MTFLLDCRAAGAGTLMWFLAASCSGSQASSASPEGGTVTDQKFDDLSPTEQKEFMQAVVVPHMGKVLKASPEPEHFEKIGCVTCHGQSAKSGNFEMPSPDLPRFASFEAALAEHPAMTRYMAEKVVPEMAKLLEEEPSDPKTGAGFGCFDCHMKPD